MLPRFATAIVAGRATVVVDTGQEIVTLESLLHEDTVPETLEALIRQWPARRDLIVQRATSLPPSAARLDARGLRWQAPVAPRALVCVGTNYRDHVAEMAAAGGAAVVDEPYPFGFLKPASSLVGSGEPVPIPAHGSCLDWEAELAVVIGDPALAGGDDPLRAVFGYGIINELSLRDFLPFPHGLGLDAVSAKAFRRSAPMAPWITLAEAVDDVQRLPVRLWVNGTVKQQSSTAQMIFPVDEVVRHFATVMELQPGDVIATGTPAGVGAGKRPQEFLADGDVVEVEIGALGRLHTPIVAGPAKCSLGSRKQPFNVT